MKINSFWSRETLNCLVWSAKKIQNWVPGWNFLKCTLVFYKFRAISFVIMEVKKKRDENVMKSLFEGKLEKSLTKYKIFIKEDFRAMHKKWGSRKVGFETMSGNENKRNGKKVVRGKSRAWEINDMQESTCVGLKTKATIIEDVFCSDRHLKALN